MGAVPEVRLVVALESFGLAEATGLAVAADEAGFAGVVLADRFQPWLSRQAGAPFVWTVAGAIGARTRGALVVSAVPGYRMHPAALAQASATLAALYPERHQLVLSAGNAIDEHVVGGYWPEAAERAERVFEAASLIRKLFSASAKGASVRHAGEHYRFETARLWTMPDAAPAIQVWAGGPASARRAGRSGEGIVVQASALERLAAVIAAYREGAAEASRTTGQVSVHAQLAWAPGDEQALTEALEGWPMAGLSFPRGDIRSPFDVDQLVRSVTAEELRDRIPISADPEVHHAHLQALLDLGADALHVHNVAGDQHAFLDIYAREIAPRLRGRS